MKRALVASVVMVLALSACASDKKPARLCPQTAIVRSLERAEDHGNDAAEDARLVGVALMQKIEGGCAYDKEGVDVDFKLFMEAEKGGALGGDKLGFPYFVSLVSPEEKIVSKEMMTAAFQFTDPATKRASLEQPLHVRIPLLKDEDASGYRVLLGFQLTEDQIKAVREKEGATP